MIPARCHVLGAFALAVAAAALPAPIAHRSTAATPEAGTAGLLTLAIDPARSALGFSVSRPGETIEGRVHAFSGEVTVDPEHPGPGTSVFLRVEAASLETGNRIRDRKMRNSHLEVDRFPAIQFRSSSVGVSRGAADDPEVAGAEPGPLSPGERRRALLKGVLSLHGVDREILFPVAIRYDNGTLTAEGDLSLRLTDHAIPLPRFLWVVLDDEVKVHFLFLAVPRADS